MEKLDILRGSRGTSTTVLVDTHGLSTAPGSTTGAYNYLLEIRKNREADRKVEPRVLGISCEVVGPLVGHSGVGK